MFLEYQNFMSSSNIFNDKKKQNKNFNDLFKIEWF